MQLGSCSVIPPKTDAQKLFENRLGYYEALVNLPVDVGKVNMPKDIGVLFGNEPKCFIEAEAFNALQANSAASQKFLDWLNSYDDQYVLDDIAYTPIFCNWGDLEDISIDWSDHKVSPHERAYFDVADRIQYVPLTLTALVESRNFINRGDVLDVPGFPEYLYGVLASIRDNLLVKEKLTKSQRDIVRQISFNIDKRFNYDLEVTSDIKEKVVYISPKFMRAAFIMTVNTYNSSKEDGVDQLSGVREFVRHIRQRKSGRYTNYGLFGGDYYTQSDFAIENMIFKKALVSNLAFVVLHEMAHIYLQEPDNEALCDCYAFALYPPGSILIERSVGFFETLLANAVRSGNGHYWGLVGDTDLAERNKRLSEMSKENLSTADCVKYRN